MSHKSNPLRAVIFVDDEYRQSHPKKRPAERACHDCRRKKKRCEHGLDLGECSETTGTVKAREGSINHNPNEASDVTQRRTLAQSDRSSHRTAENGRRGAQAETRLVHNQVLFGYLIDLPCKASSNRIFDIPCNSRHQYLLNWLFIRPYK